MNIAISSFCGAEQYILPSLKKHHRGWFEVEIGKSLQSNKNLTEPHYNFSPGRILIKTGRWWTALLCFTSNPIFWQKLLWQNSERRSGHVLFQVQFCKLEKSGWLRLGFSTEESAAYLLNRRLVRILPLQFGYESQVVTRPLLAQKQFNSFWRTALWGTWDNTNWFETLYQPQKSIICNFCYSKEKNNHVQAIDIAKTYWVISGTSSTFQCTLL